LAKFSADIKGPYLLGEQYSLSDIAFFPFVERALTAGAKHRNFFLPSGEEFKNVRNWYELVSSREAVRVTTAARTPESVAVYPFGARDRTGYLAEVYAPYYYDQIEYSKGVLKNAPPGVSTLNADEMKRRKEADLAAKKQKAIVRQPQSRL